MNEDGKVDMRDVAAVAAHFGEKETGPQWYPLFDVYPEEIGIGKIDMRDISWTTAYFGYHLQDPTSALDGDFTWFIGGPGDHLLSRNVSGNCIPALTGENVTFGFWFRRWIDYTGDGYCRADLRIWHGSSYDDFLGVAVLSLPGPNWTAVYVEATCPSDAWAIEVKVNVRSMAVFIDSATFSPFESDNFGGECGDMSVGCNLYSYRRDQGLTFDGIVRAVSTIYAEAKPGYKIAWTKLEMESLSLSDQMNLDIQYCTQGNDMGYIIDPEAVEQAENERLLAASYIIPIVVTGTLTFGVGAIIGSSTMAVLARFIFGSTINSAVKYYLPFLASNADNPHAGGYDPVWEQWNYPTVLPIPDWFVNAANAACEFNWSFDSDADDMWYLLVRATVCFGQPVGSYEDFGLINLVAYAKSVVIAINTAT